MTYAGPLPILDADSHVMELSDFLDDHIDPDQRDRLRRRAMEGFAPLLEGALAGAAARRSDPAVAGRAEERLLEDKGWLALGAFDPGERSRALDLLGFEGQLVFATFASTMFAGRDADRLYAGSAAKTCPRSAEARSEPRISVLYIPSSEVAAPTSAARSSCTWAASRR